MYRPRLVDSDLQVYNQGGLGVFEMQITPKVIAPKYFWKNPPKKTKKYLKNFASGNY